MFSTSHKSKEYIHTSFRHIKNQVQERVKVLIKIMQIKKPENNRQFDELSNQSTINRNCC